MKIVTNLAIPDKVYLFYYELAKNLPDCTTEDIITDALERYMSIISADVIQKILNDCSSNDPNPHAGDQ